jgi:hypothetical protein
MSETKSDQSASTGTTVSLNEGYQPPVQRVPEIKGYQPTIERGYQPTLSVPAINPPQGGSAIAPPSSQTNGSSQGAPNPPQGRSAIAPPTPAPDQK